MIPVTGVVPIDQMIGDCEEDTIQLRLLAAKAADYLRSFPWCATILESYFGGGVGKIFDVFCYHIVPARADVDEWLWVVAGDIPSTYIQVIDECRTPVEVFETYDWGMTKWIDLARQGRTSPDLPPVNVPSTPEWAEELDGRLQILRRVIKPFLGAA